MLLTRFKYLLYIIVIEIITKFQIKRCNDKMLFIIILLYITSLFTVLSLSIGINYISHSQFNIKKNIIAEIRRRRPPERKKNSHKNFIYGERNKKKNRKTSTALTWLKGAASKIRTLALIINDTQLKTQCSLLCQEASEDKSKRRMACEIKKNLVEANVRNF